MTEIFGAAASTLAVAQTGWKTYEFIRAIRNADSQLEPIANNVKLTSNILREIGVYLRREEVQLVHKSAFFSSVDDSLRGCEDAFRGVEKTLKAMIKPDGAGCSNLSLSAKLAWPFKQKDLNLLQARLEHQKSNLDIVLGVLNLEVALQSTQRSDEIFALKRQMNDLIQAKNESEKDGGEHAIGRPNVGPKLPLLLAKDSRRERRSHEAQKSGSDADIIAHVSSDTAPRIGHAFLELPLVVTDLNGDSSFNAQLLAHLHKSAAAVEMLSRSLQETITMCSRTQPYRREHLREKFQITHDCVQELFSFEERHGGNFTNLQQQPLPRYTSSDNFGMMHNTNEQNEKHTQQGGLQMFPGIGREALRNLDQTSPADHGLADQMSPPEINIDYAPPASHIDWPRLTDDGETLSPPIRTQSRNRIRAKSDSFAGSRSPSPVPSRGRSPSLQPSMQGGDKLSLFDNSSPSPPSSWPACGRDDSLGQRHNQSSSSASDQRDYILDLAIPERSPSNSGDKSGRVQKHPAIFQCTLCPKRFTRAYNLRSHLRTHTDERPFVCTFCGKAFARQHDRKRHEGLHSSEKRFICKGPLQGGNQWGCGRRFARADMLGRHFRSEAGRVCIKPLFNEEAAERQKLWMEEPQQTHVAAGLIVSQPMMPQAGRLDMMSSILPEALLQQYPALAGIDWSTVPQGPPPSEEDNDRCSFGGSNGGEYSHDDVSENEMGDGNHYTTLMSTVDTMGSNSKMDIPQTQADDMIVNEMHVPAESPAELRIALNQLCNVEGYPAVDELIKRWTKA